VSNPFEDLLKSLEKIAQEQAPKPPPTKADVEKIAALISADLKTGFDRVIKTLADHLQADRWNKTYNAVAGGIYASNATVRLEGAHADATRAADRANGPLLIKPPPVEVK